MRRIARTVLLAALFIVPMLPAVQTSAAPCMPEGPCVPCPIVITFEGGKPHIGHAQC